MRKILFNSNKDIIQGIVKSIIILNVLMNRNHVKIMIYKIRKVIKNSIDNLKIF